MADILATTEKVTREKRVLVGPPQPVMQTIYEKETGKPLEVYAADAREILNQPDSAYQAMPKGEENTKPAPLDHSVKEVIGTSSDSTIITSATGAKGGPAAKSAASGESDTEDTRTKAELQEAAEAKGITVKASHTKADIQHLLELDGKTKSELVEMAEAKGIDAKGTKAEIINALADAD